LKDAGIEYFVGDSHAILYGEPRPRYGVHAPVKCPNGVGGFRPRCGNFTAGLERGSRLSGQCFYREFYRDIGWDLPLEYLKPHLHKDGKRRNLGLKYYRITGRTEHKKAVYSGLGEKKRRKTRRILSENESGKRIFCANLLESRPPLVVSPYDAELYGHWWFEGPQFLDFLFRELHYEKDVLVRAVTPGDFLDAKIPIQIQQPSASSWGANGYYKVWLNEKIRGCIRISTMPKSE
jgi:1,4-alpha-glucan branching enzyme